MIRTIPMIRVDDGKTADVHPDEVENWKPHGWAIDEARVQAQIEETERIEQEAAEKARAEAERIAAEEEARRKADAAAAARQAETSAGEQDTPPRNDDDAAGHGTGPTESAAGATVSAEGGNGAADAETKPLTVAKGPGGRWFLKSGDKIVSNGFPTEEAANAELAEIGDGAQK